jgi:hypothetical protein
MNTYHLLIGLPVLALALAGPVRAQTGQSQSATTPGPAHSSGKAAGRANLKADTRIRGAAAIQKPSAADSSFVSDSIRTPGTAINADAGVSTNGTATASPPGGGSKLE